MLFCAQSLRADESDPPTTPEASASRVYSLDDCIRLALERSVSLENLRRERLIADERIRQVRAQILPSLAAQSSYTRLDEAPVVEDRTGSHDRYEAGLALSQLLFSGGSVFAALQAARDFKDFADEDIERLDRVITRNVTLAFYDLLYAEAALSVARDSLAQLQEFERQTRLRYEAETASEFELLSAQVKVANERPRVIVAQNALEVAYEAFRHLIYEDDADFSVRGGLEIVPVEVELDHLNELALENRPELRIMDSAISMRQQDVRATRGEYYPRVYAVANYQGGNPGRDKPADDDWQWNWTAGFALSWNIMDGGLRRGQVNQKQLVLDQARAERDDVVRGILLEVKNAWLELKNAQEAARGAEQNVTLAQKALAIAEVRYQQGLFTYLEYTDSNLSLTQAKLIHFQSQQAYQKALASLRYACGTEELTREQ